MKENEILYKNDREQEWRSHFPVLFIGFRVYKQPGIASRQLSVHVPHKKRSRTWEKERNIGTAAQTHNGLRIFLDYLRQTNDSLEMLHLILSQKGIKKAFQFSALFNDSKVGFFAIRLLSRFKIDILRHILFISLLFFYIYLCIFSSRRQSANYYAFCLPLTEEKIIKKVSST